MKNLQVYLRGKRLSAAFVLSDETVVKIFPEKKIFPSEVAWKEFWSCPCERCGGKEVKFLTFYSSLQPA